MLRNQLQFQQSCQTNIESIKNPKRTIKPHQYDSCINNPLTQQFSNIKLASTLSMGRSIFQKQLEQMKQQYIVRTGYIRIADPEILKELFELNLENMKKKYSKYSNIYQLNIPKEMIKIFMKFGYQEINKFMQMAIVHLLFEYKSLLQYQDKWEKDAVIALTSIAFIKQDCLYPQVMIVSPDDQSAIAIKVMLDHLNIYYNNVYQVSKKNSIVQDRKSLKEAQIVIGTADRLYYVIYQKYLNPIFLESVVFQEFSQTTDLGYKKDIENILRILPKSTSKHFFFSQVFNIEEHDILDI
ncbi:unnamed protein product [Paramecium pentaurelia]|uniref:DEAD/DEAH-box helicase domain-containing protein n=1 Tax=Paramecium pentaurelia TaxID=43138 RepID=A0A8S1XRR9_9CILI|nr:unnamed protein product [Paramecium pentaurelia]